MKLLDILLTQAQEQNATDIHFGEGYKPFLRIDGNLIEQEDWEPGTEEHLDEIVRAIFVQEQIEALEIRIDIDASFTHKKSGRRIRAHAYWERGRLNVALRLLPLRIPAVEEIGLGFLKEKILNLSEGLVLVSGPTGSGKSTTIASFLDAFNREKRRHIITIEDPIEYVHENVQSLIKHREVGRDGGDVPLFPQALKSAMREDPDIIFVGEMRDLDTMRLALRIAETGHLVFSTVHASLASQIPSRIVSMFPPGEQERIQAQFAHILRLAIAQRLLIKKGGGLVGAYEVLVNNPAVRNLIIDGKFQGLRDTMKTSRHEGMILLEDAISELEEKGLVEPQDKEQ